MVRKLRSPEFKARSLMSVIANGFPIGEGDLAGLNLKPATSAMKRDDKGERVINFRQEPDLSGFSWMYRKSISLMCCISFSMLLVANYNTSVWAQEPAEEPFSEDILGLDFDSFDLERARSQADLQKKNLKSQQSSATILQENGDDLPKIEGIAEDQDLTESKSYILGNLTDAEKMQVIQQVPLLKATQNKQRDYLISLQNKGLEAQSLALNDSAVINEQEVLVERAPLDLANQQEVAQVTTGEVAMGEVAMGEDSLQELSELDQLALDNQADILEDNQGYLTQEFNGNDLDDTIKRFHSELQLFEQDLVVLQKEDENLEDILAENILEIELDTPDFVNNEVDVDYILANKNNEEQSQAEIRYEEQLNVGQNIGTDIFDEEFTNEILQANNLITPEQAQVLEAFEAAETDQNNILSTEDIKIATAEDILNYEPATSSDTIFDTRGERITLVEDIVMALGGGASQITSNIEQSLTETINSLGDTVDGLTGRITSAVDEFRGAVIRRGDVQEEVVVVIPDEKAIETKADRIRKEYLASIGTAEVAEDESSRINRFAKAFPNNKPFDQFRVEKDANYYSGAYYIKRSFNSENVRLRRGGYQIEPNNYINYVAAAIRSGDVIELSALLSIMPAEYSINDLQFEGGTNIVTYAMNYYRPDVVAVIVLRQASLSNKDSNGMDALSMAQAFQIAEVENTVRYFNSFKE